MPKMACGELSLFTVNIVIKIECLVLHTFYISSYLSANIYYLYANYILTLCANFIMCLAVCKLYYILTCVQIILYA